MPKSMSPEELVRTLNEGGFKPAIVRSGLVKVNADDQNSLMFSEGRGCHAWTRIPLDAIESVEYESLVRCHDHQHPFVQLHLKAPTDNPTATLFAELLMHGAGAASSESIADLASDSGESFEEPAESLRLLASTTQRIDIGFQANGNGVMNCYGLGTFRCQGRPGARFRYPIDITVTTADKELLHISREFNGPDGRPARMPFAIRIWPARGIYIHEWGYCQYAPGQTSEGCIHLCPGDAVRVYNWIVGRTRITIHYPW
jgi:hypothetical protein